MVIKNHFDSQIIQVDINALKPHPKNSNKHSESQIQRLAKLLEYQGWRYPIKVSKLSGHIVSGHGRLEAAKLLGLKSVPVVYQDYDSEEQEYADLTADNAIAAWSELDLSLINQEIGSLGPDFDIELLGLKNFQIDLNESLERESVLDVSQYILTVICKNENELASLYEEMKERGHDCKLIT